MPGGRLALRAEDLGIGDLELAEALRHEVCRKCVSGSSAVFSES